MIKYIIGISDLHFRGTKELDELKQVLKNFISQAKEIIETHGSDSVRIIIAGDIFHDKVTVTNESMIAVSWFFNELNNLCRTYVIAGNHDFLQNNLDRVDSITPIFDISNGTLKNVIYLDRELDFKSGCYVDDNFTLALWSAFDGFNTPDVVQQRILHPENTVVGVVHADINGCTSLMNTTLNTGINPIIFKDCDFVVAGHIHKHQEIKEEGVKIVYCSSLKQQNFGETVEGHGFVLWSFDEEYQEWVYELVEVENPGKRYFKFEITDIEDFENDLEHLLN